MQMSSKISYSYASLDRVRANQEAMRADWLSPGEYGDLERFRDRLRRETWLAGRLLAKRLIARELTQYSRCHEEDGNDIFPSIRPRDIEIRSGRSRPQASIHGRPLHWSLSIAHTNRGVLAALSTLPGIVLGVDLIEPSDYGAGFSKVWFTPAERRWLASAESSLVHAMHASIWAIKEAIYKAINAGEPFDPRLIETATILENYCNRCPIARQTARREIAVIVALKSGPLCCAKKTSSRHNYLLQYSQNNNRTLSL
jgi:phosphopantetheinyl transferase